MSLQLITTEQFNGLDCNFYRNMNDDMLLTREQIGTALGYADPQKAIKKIHLTHHDRLDQFSILAPILGGPQNGAPPSGRSTKDNALH